MKVAIYPGSFDPITNGHLDIIKRSAKIFDEVIVTVMVNPNKEGLFTSEERVEMIKSVTSKLNNVKATSFNGLLVDFMKGVNSNIIIKGLRAVSDFEYEFQMALMNKQLNPNVETVFMMTNAKYSYLSSSAIKQVAQFNGCIRGLVPEKVIGEIQNRIKSLK